VQWTQEQAQAAEAFRHSDSAGGAYFLVIPETFVGWFESSLQANLVLDRLDRFEHLIKTNPKVRTGQAAVSGIKGRLRYYAVQEKALTAA
jgi:hypothetical protein